LIWVHDYHLIACGQELRAMGFEHRIGFFLHIPFPATEVLLTLPNHQTLVRSLFAYDLIGFQTEPDVRAFTDYVLHEAGGTKEADGSLTCFGRTVRVGAFPIGIDTADFVKMTNSPEAQRQCERMRNSARDRAVVLGVDRL